MSKKFLESYVENFQNEYGQSLLKKHKETIEYLEEHSGLKIPTSRQGYYLRDMIKVQVSGKFF